MATLFLLCGMPGAGKTTLAVRLARRHRALHLDPDAWLVRLGLDPFDDDLRKRVGDLQDDQVLELLRLGVSVVVETGTWLRAQRSRQREAARAVGARVELHVLDVPLQERWRRISARNERPGAVVITYDQLVSYERLWQAPTAAERAMFDAPEPDETAAAR